MKANELMIGDWVKKGTLFGQVVDIEQKEKYTIVGVELIGEGYDVYTVDELEPIPLTHEILEENFRGYKRGSGALTYFVYELNEDYFIRASAGDIDLCMHYDDSEHAAHDDIYLVELKYVHTLQHALRLFGFDKEIVL